MSRGNYLWERCGTMRCGFYRGHPSYPTCTREIREFLISLRLQYEFDRKCVACKGRKEASVSGDSSAAHASRFPIFSKLFWQPLKRALRLELRKNPRTSAVGFSLSATTEARAALLSDKAWFIASIRDLNCRATRGADGTRSRRLRRKLLYLSLKIN